MGYKILNTIVKIKLKISYLVNTKRTEPFPITPTMPMIVSKIP